MNYGTSQAVAGMQVTQRGSIPQPAPSSPIDQLISHARFLNEAVHSAMVELATHTERMIGGESLPAQTEEIKSVPFPFAGAVGELAQVLNNMGGTVVLLQRAVRQATQL